MTGETPTNKVLSLTRNMTTPVFAGMNVFCSRERLNKPSVVSLSSHE